MTCTHLKQLYQLCQDSQIQLSSTDLIHIVCKQCENVEVCPSVLFEDYDQLSEAQAQLHATQEQTPPQSSVSSTAKGK